MVIADEGWIKISNRHWSAAQNCSLNKVRKMPGLVVLCGRMQIVMLQRSFLVDRIEPYKGESLQLDSSKDRSLDAFFAFVRGSHS